MLNGNQFLSYVHQLCIVLMMEFVKESGIFPYTLFDTNIYLLNELTISSKLFKSFVMICGCGPYIKTGSLLSSSSSESVSNRSSVPTDIDCDRSLSVCVPRATPPFALLSAAISRSICRSIWTSIGANIPAKTGNLIGSVISYQLSLSMIYQYDIHLVKGGVGHLPNLAPRLATSNKHNITCFSFFRMIRSSVSNSRHSNICRLFL